MPWQSLSVRFSGINSASNGIDRGASCNFVIFCSIKYKYFDQYLVFFANSVHMIHENTLFKSGFLQLGHIASWGHRILVASYEMSIKFEPP